MQMPKFTKRIVIIAIKILKDTISIAPIGFGLAERNSDKEYQILQFVLKNFKTQMLTFSNMFVNVKLSQLIPNLQPIFSISIPKIAIPHNPYHSDGYGTFW